MFSSEDNKNFQGKIEIFGMSWCSKTQSVRRFFDRMKIPYQYVDLETEPGATGQLRWITGGSARHPTVIIDGQALIEPSISELEVAVAKYL